MSSANLKSSFQQMVTVINQCLCFKLHFSDRNQSSVNKCDLSEIKLKIFKRKISGMKQSKNQESSSTHKQDILVTKQG